MSGDQSQTEYVGGNALGDAGWDEGQEGECMDVDAYPPLGGILFLRVWSLVRNVDDEGDEEFINIYLQVILQ